MKKYKTFSRNKKKYIWILLIMSPLIGKELIRGSFFEGKMNESFIFYQFYYTFVA